MSILSHRTCLLLLYYYCNTYRRREDKSSCILNHGTNVEVSGQLQAVIALSVVKYTFFCSFDSFVKLYLFPDLVICQFTGSYVNEWQYVCEWVY
jgi:hypothetical protein